MKKVLFTMMLAFVAVIGANTAIAQEVQNGAKIEFAKETHDYGNIKYGANGTCTFSFTNTGNAPLIISNAKGSCGCTVPEWPKEPIAPGAKGVITVKYDTKRSGAINKNVTITSNAVNEPTKVIRIKGNVAPQPEGTSPVNDGGAPSAH
ncbi:hypothetical protein D3C87_13140 [compost metagenome]|uniref:DUF1573 domain-containing protein n=1 Tax=Fluviicola sp. TaxID=1917219 RepID=UPI000F5C7F03